jgi:alpha-beta hydrolase superfamily lysophospholipase
MRPCYHVEIVTPKKVLLNGLWFGPKKAHTVILWVHGLGSSAFSKLAIADKLCARDTAVLMFNNRGSGTVSRATKAGKRLLGGSAHEVFTDCVDDIQGAINSAHRNGARNIFLAGHSTGCQKSIYWAYKRHGRGVKGIILLAPVSDYAGAIANHGKKKIERVARFAQSLIRLGKPHELIPRSLWSEELDDAQRFVSLYTPNSIEEIFSYVQPKKNPRVLKSVKTPILVLWAEKDEFADRPAKRAAAWFDANIQAPHKVTVIPNVKHSFKGGEKKVASAIRTWIKAR